MSCGTLYRAASAAYDDRVLRIDPGSGRIWLVGFDEPLAPRLRHAAFRRHPACAVMPELPERTRGMHHEHRLPDGVFEGCRVRGEVSFDRGALESLWLQVLASERDGKLFRFEREDAAVLERQARWLREVVGVESRDYPWGLVWNRFNIHAGWHDVAIIFKKS